MTVEWRPRLAAILRASPDRPSPVALEAFADQLGAEARDSEDAAVPAAAAFSRSLATLVRMEEAGASLDERAAALAIAETALTILRAAQVA